MNDNTDKRKSKDLVPYVYNYLKDMILNLKIKCGDRIPEEWIVHELGISRTPVREALRRLSNDGLIIIYPRRFSQVITFTEEDVMHLSVVRTVLDTLSVQLAVHNGSNADFMKLSGIIDECVTADKEGDIHKRISKDMEFHLLLTEIGGNPYLTSIQKSIMLKIHLLLRVRLTENPSLDTFNIEAHYDIVNALLDRDEKRAVDLVQKHLGTFYSIGNERVKSMLVGTDQILKFR